LVPGVGASPHAVSFMPHVVLEDGSMASVQAGGAGNDLSGETVIPRSRAAVIRQARQDTIQALWLFIPLFYGCFFNYLRPFGTAPLLIVFGALVYVALTFGRKYIHPALLLFAALAVVYIALSYAGVLDRRITLLYSRDAILQQSVYAVMLPFAVAGFAVYHDGVSQGKRTFIQLETVLLMMAAAVKLSNVVVPTEDSLTGEMSRDYGGIAQMINPIAFLVFVLVRRTLASPGASHAARIGIILVLFITSQSAQANIALLILVPMVLFPKSRRSITLWFLVALLAIIVAAWPYAEQVWIMDPNTGIRLFFWHDVLERLWESRGTGVGFGTETIRPVYELHVTNVSLVGEESGSFIYIGSHNAFMDAAYRMGVIGFLILTLFMGRMLVKVIRSPEALIMDCWVACALMVILMVNVGLASFNLFFGSVFFTAWLVFRTSTMASPRKRAVA
jgi:hypothetical protein